MRILDRVTSPTTDDYNKLFDLQMETARKLFIMISLLKEAEDFISIDVFIGRSKTKIVKNKIREALLLCS